jgi:hypothetical protein
MLTASTNWIAAFSKLELQPVYRVVIEGYYRSFTTDISSVNDDPWLQVPEDHQKQINDLDGGAQTEQLVFNVQDHVEIGQTTGALTQDMGAGTVFEGSLVQLYIGDKSMSSTSDYLLYWQGYVDQVDSDNANLEYKFTCFDVTKKLAQVVYQTGDDGAQTSSDSIKTLTGHPLSILLDILTNQLRDPVSGQALDQSLIDFTKIDAYIAGPFQGVEMYFRLTQPVQALDFIKNQLLKPLGGYLWVSQGKLTVNFFYPLAPPSPTLVIGPDQWTTIPTAEQTQMLNTVVVKFDKDDSGSTSSGNYLSTNTQQYGPSVKKYGLFGEQDINADGLRAALQGYLISRLVSFLIFGRYGFKNLMFDQAAPPGIMYPFLLLEPGDLVLVTHPQVPDRKAGVMGIVNKQFEILHKKTSFKDGQVTPSMIDASYLYNFGFRETAPDSEGHYTSTSTSDKAQFMFQSGLNGKYSNGDAGGVLG